MPEITPTTGTSFVLLTMQEKSENFPYIICRI